ncbi:MAG: hypothetical protein ACYTDE_01345 [Planctomycetota bacterium]
MSAIRPTTADTRMQGLSPVIPVPDVLETRVSHRSNLDMTGLLPHC